MAEPQQAGQTLDKLMKDGWRAADTTSSAPSSRLPPMNAQDILLHEFRGTMPPASEREIPKMHAPTGNEPVTMQEIAADPIDAFKRIGVRIGRDATDPKMWLTLAASYFGPKLLPAAARAIGQGRAATAPLAETLITKKLGMDPEAIQLQAAKMRLQAARSQTRQGRLAAEIAKAQQPAATSPAATVTASPANALPESVSAGPAPAVGPLPESAPVTAPTNTLPDQKALNQEAIARRQALYQATQAAKAEATLYSELRAKNLTDAEARKVLAAKAAMEKLGGLGGTMTDAEREAEIAARIGNRSPKR